MGNSDACSIYKAINSLTLQVILSVTKAFTYQKVCGTCRLQLAKVEHDTVGPSRFLALYSYLSNALS
jgi:hypothetical protein